MSFQNRLAELNQNRDQGEEELDKMQDQGSQELEQLQNEGDAYEDEGDAYDRVQAEAEMQLYYGLDDNHNLDDGFDDEDGYY